LVKAIAMSPTNDEHASAKEQAQQSIEFDYTDAQWAEIEACISAASKKPWSTEERNRLPENVRDIHPPEQRRELLNIAAVEYLSLLRRRELTNYVLPHQQQKKWRGLTKQIDALRNNIIDALALSERKLLDPFKMIDFPVHISLTGRLTGATWGDAVDILAQLQAGAEHYSNRSWWEPPIGLNLSGRQEPRLVYLQFVLTLWTTFGGRLRLSQNPGKVSGPLARYLKAVTVPVMGHDAPKAGSYRKLVDRQKELYREFNKIHGNAG